MNVIVLKMLVSKLVLPTLTPKASIFGFLDSTSSDSKFLKNKLLINHIPLLFKLHVCKSIERQFIFNKNLIAQIKSAKMTEKKNCYCYNRF